jgi:hypothetical protein
MPHSIPKPAIEIKISVQWEGGDRTFYMAISHEAIVASSPEDALLAKSLQEKIKVSFEHWRKLEVQLNHVWNNGQTQLIYSNSSSSNHQTEQDDVIRMLSIWQQHACIEPGNMRMTLILNINIEGVHMLPARPKLESLNQGRRRGSHLSSSPDRTLLIPKACDEEIKETESDVTFKTTLYSNTTPITEDIDMVETEPEEHIKFDRCDGSWNRIVFLRVRSS